MLRTLRLGADAAKASARGEDRLGERVVLALGDPGRDRDLARDRREERGEHHDAGVLDVRPAARVSEAEAVVVGDARPRAMARPRPVGDGHSGDAVRKTAVCRLVVPRDLAMHAVSGGPGAVAATRV